MQLVALSPIPVAPLVWRRDARTWMLTVVCKASFDLIPGEMRLSAQQDVINEQDQRWEDDSARSVHAPDDLAPFKTRADVTLVGNAFAPGGKPVRSLMARLVCGGIDKTIAVFGDRVRLGHPEPAAFKRMPLRYERAAGGPGTANPVGAPERPPNLEPARRVEGATPPVGFGPIAADWPERRARLGPHAAWAPTEPFPDDVDSSYFNFAPLDQQLPALRNDQQVYLEHLHSEHARLDTRLPGMHPQAFLDRPGNPAQEIEMRPDGLWIDTDRARCAVTWRTQIPLTAADEPGRVLIAMVSGRQQLTWKEINRLDEALSGSREPVRRANPGLPQVGHDADDEEENLNTTIALRPSLNEAEAPSQQPAWLATRAKPTPLPEPSPLPHKRSPTLHGQGPARRPTLQPTETAAPPPAASPLLPRVHVDPEATSTELFIVGEHRAVPDNSPAWLASTAPAATTEPAPASPSSPPPPHAVAASTGAAPAAQAPHPAVAEAGAARAVDDVIDLLWFDPESLPRIRARWPAIIDQLELEPLDARHDLPADGAAGSRTRHQVFGVLTRAEITDAGGVAREMMGAVDDRGRFTPPLVVIGGDLRFPFDEIETLKTAAAAAKPLSKDDKKLTDLLEMVGELLETPLLQGSPDLVESLVRDLNSAIQQSKRALPAKYLDAYLDRVLLERRKYQRRTVFGGPCLRALLGRDGAAVPAYLPESLADKLPLVTQMKARLIAEVSASQDQYETHPHALRVVALGRVMGLDAVRSFR